MNQIELLAPAGDKESLIAAVQNGANAIYLGGTMFNARAFAKNFDKEELCWAVQYAHLRNVRIFVTVNTLYRDNEIDDLMQYINYLYHIQVDALIIQDIGLFHIVHTNYPDFEIHMSTQSSVMNQSGVQYFEKMGASRVVLARENTIEEIKQICSSTSLDIEVFVHGALCVCYSGQCLMSSFIGKRSGNRGECAQPCRLKYRLMEDEHLLNDEIPYLLSPKDLMTIHHVDQLIEAGVHSFKIEGRMKRPEYVGSVVKAYRKVIDAYFTKQKVSLNDNIFEMKSMFNRDYTTGYAFHDSQLLVGDYPGNKGIIIGKVQGYHKKNNRVMIKLFDDLKQEDSIVFEEIDKGRPVNKIFFQNHLVSHAQKGDIIEIEFNDPVYNGYVRKTINKDIIDKIKKTYNHENRKQPIEMSFYGEENNYAYLTLSYENIKVQKKSSIKFEKALTTPLTQERIVQQLSKLGNTVFYPRNLNVNIQNNITMPIKAINELRRDAIEELTQIIQNQKIHQDNINNFIILNKQNAYKHDVHVLVNNIQQLKTVLRFPIDHIYYPYQSDALKAYRLCQSRHKEMILFIPRICKQNDLNEILNSPIYKEVHKVVVNDYGSYYSFSNKERIIGTGFNIYNSYSASFFQEKKILSLEMSQKQMINLKTDLSKCIIQIYGKIENMISEYCPISQYYFKEQKKNCQICQHHRYSIIDRKKEKFELLMDEKCRMHLLNCKTLYIDDLSRIPVQGYLLHFTNENSFYIEDVLDDFFSYVLKGQKTHLKDKNKWTLGYFKT